MSGPNVEGKWASTSKSGMGRCSGPTAHSPLKRAAPLTADIRLTKCRVRVGWSRRCDVAPQALDAGGNFSPSNSVRRKRIDVGHKRGPDCVVRDTPLSKTIGSPLATPGAGFLHGAANVRSIVRDR
jgi:hypothetical protein